MKQGADSILRGSTSQRLFVSSRMLLRPKTVPRPPWTENEWTPLSSSPGHHSAASLLFVLCGNRATGEVVDLPLHDFEWVGTSGFPSPSILVGHAVAVLSKKH